MIVKWIYLDYRDKIRHFKDLNQDFSLFPDWKLKEKMKITISHTPQKLQTSTLYLKKKEIETLNIAE